MAVSCSPYCLSACFHALCHLRQAILWCACVRACVRRLVNVRYRSALLPFYVCVAMTVVALPSALTALILQSVHSGETEGFSFMASWRQHISETLLYILGFLACMIGLASVLAYASMNKMRTKFVLSIFHGQGLARKHASRRSMAQAASVLAVLFVGSAVCCLCWLLVHVAYDFSLVSPMQGETHPSK